MFSKVFTLGLLLGSSFVSAAVLTGKVSDPNGTAMAGAQLYLAPLSIYAEPCDFGPKWDSAVSGTDGSFQFQAVPEFYKLRARRPGFTESCDIVELKDTGSYREVQVSVNPNPGFTIIGVALEAGPAHKRLPGLPLILDSRKGMEDTLITDANGEFKIVGTAPTPEFYIRVEKESFNTRSEPFFELNEGQVRTIKIELQPEPARAGEPGSVSGIITDKYTGLPVAGAWVSLQEVKSAYRNPYRDSALTDAQGHYTINAVPANTTLGEGFVLFAKYPRYHLGIKQLFNLQPKENLTLDLSIEKEVTLSLFTQERVTGRQLERVHITAQPSAPGYPPYVGQTDSSGWITFQQIAIGEEGITVALNGYRTVFIPKNISGKIWDESLSVVLEPAASNETQSLHGTPSFAGGSGSYGHIVYFRAAMADSSLLFFNFTNPDGSFSFSEIPSACTQGMLISDGDSLAVSLNGLVTEVTYDVSYPIILDVKRPAVTPPQRPTRIGGFIGFDLLGRQKFSAPRSL